MENRIVFDEEGKIREVIFDSVTISIDELGNFLAFLQDLKKEHNINCTLLSFDVTGRQL